MTRTITITSGKGGVGKTSISVNMGLHLAQLGHRVCLFDADLGLANVNILLKLNPEFTLEDVIVKGCSLRRVMVTDYEGMDIIPGSSGIEKMADLGTTEVDALVRSFSELDEYDFVILDTSAGVSRDVVSFCLASPEVILVVTPEPTSLTDGYALLKILSRNDFRGQVRVIVNQCKDSRVAKATYARLKNAVQKHLFIRIEPVGVVVQDDHVVASVERQRPFILIHPDSNASKCIKQIAKRLLGNGPRTSLEMTSFWTSCLNFMTNSVALVGAGDKDKTTDPVSSSNSGDLAKTASPVQDIPLLLSKSAEQISSVVRELQLIREAIDKLRSNGMASTNGPAPAKTKTILLDFEAYISSRNGATMGNKDE